MARENNNKCGSSKDFEEGCHVLFQDIVLASSTEVLKKTAK
jgi:hypothetical protein